MDIVKRKHHKRCHQNFCILLDSEDLPHQHWILVGGEVGVECCWSWLRQTHCHHSLYQQNGRHSIITGKSSVSVAATTRWFTTVSATLLSPAIKSTVSAISKDCVFYWPWLYFAVEFLTILSLSRNNLKKIEGLEPIADTLQELWLSYNLIERVNGIEVCKKLKVLYLANNRVKAWEGFDKLARECDFDWWDVERFAGFRRIAVHWKSDWRETQCRNDMAWWGEQAIAAIEETRWETDYPRWWSEGRCSRRCRNSSSCVSSTSEKLTNKCWIIHVIWCPPLMDGKGPDS